MDEAGNTKDDVKLPEDDVGDRISKMFRDDEKDCSKLSWDSPYLSVHIAHHIQTSSSSLLWVRSVPWMSRKPPRATKRLEP